MNLYRHFTANAEHLQPFPFRRELAMQAYLIENEGILGLDDELFSGANVEILEEELHLCDGRISKKTDGRIDVLACYSNEYLAVVELKLGMLEDCHLIQLKDYLNKRAELLIKVSEKAPESPNWVGILVGDSIAPDLAKKLQNGYLFDNSIPIVALTIQRFQSDNGGVYVTTDAFHNIGSSTKDYTKYEFNGAVYGKGKLVLAFVKQYVGDHPNTTYAELERMLPPKLQGTVKYRVFTTLKNAQELASKTKRHYIKPEEVVKLPDATIAVCSQWGVGNIERFLDVVHQLGYKIQKKITNV